MSSLAEPSLCIPRVFDNIPWRVVKDKFENQFHYGVVDRVDMIPKIDDKGEKFKRVFIHFKEWNVEDERIKGIRDTLLKGEEVCETYQEPWFWKFSSSRLEKPSRDQLPKSPHVPRKKINLGDIHPTRRHSSRERKQVVGGVSTRGNRTTHSSKETTRMYDTLLKEVIEKDKELKRLQERLTEKDKIIEGLNYQLSCFKDRV